MFFLRKSRVFFVILLFSLTSQCLGTPLVCLTGRIVKTLPSYGQSFINAARLAELNYPQQGQLRIKEFFYDNRPLSPVIAYQNMVNNKCDAIIGYEYLSDLLLVVKFQKNLNIPIFTSYSTTESSRHLPKNIFILSPSYDYLAQKMFNYINQEHPKIDNVLILTERNRDSMDDYEKAYIKIFNQNQVSFKTFEFLEDDPLLISKLEKYLSNKNQFKYVILLSGVIASAKIADYLNNNGKVVFIGTENFGSSSAESFYTRISNKLINAYFIRNLDFLNPNFLLAKFQNTYQSHFRDKPLLLSAYTYDAMRILLESYSKNHSVATNSIYNTNYEGITGIDIKNGVFTRSNYFIILKVSPSGYKYVYS